MGSNGIEDILIGESYKSTKKSSAGIWLFIIIFIIILAGSGYAYYYYSNSQVTDKKLFFDNISTLNLNSYTENNVYLKLYSKIVNDNYKSNSEISYSSTLEDLKIGNYKINNFILDIDSQIDNKDKSMFTTFDVDYSGNGFMNLKVVADENKIAALSNNVVTKYVSCNYENLESYLGLKHNQNLINNFISTETIKIENKDISTRLKKYLKIISDNTTDSEYSIEENIVIPKANKDFGVTAYKLNVDQVKFNNILISILEDIKDDEELLNLLVTDKKVITHSGNNPIIIPEEIQGEKNNLETEATLNTEELANNENVENSELNQEQVAPEIDRSKVLDYDLTKYENYLLDDFLLFGKKQSTTINEVKKSIDKLIDEIGSMEGNGFSFVFYKSEEKIEKISIVMPNGNTIEINFNSLTDKRLDFSITYLYHGNKDSLLSIEKEVKKVVEEEKVEIFSKNHLYSKESIDGNQINGYTLNIVYTKDDSTNSLDVIYNIIEDETINKKIMLTIDTEGKSSSKKLSNEILATFSTSEGERKLVIDNEISFVDKVDIPTFNDENCLLLETLNQDDLDITLHAIKDQFKKIYEQQKDRLEFYDKNSNSSTMNRLSIANSKEEARQALYNRVVEMMNEAINNGQEFTINDLNNLTIEGYQVKTTINEEIATIVVDVYTFTIDKDFNLSQ